MPREPSNHATQQLIQHARSWLEMKTIMNILVIGIVILLPSILCSCGNSTEFGVAIYSGGGITVEPCTVLSVGAKTFHDGPLTFYWRI